MKRIYAILYSLLALAAGACSEEITPEPYTYTQHFTGENSRAWRLDGFVVKEQGRGDVTIPRGSLDDVFGPCVADDLYVFYANAQRSFEVNEGASTCTAGDPQVFLTDTWGFTNASATLSFVIPFLSTNKLPFIVRSASDTRMEVEIFFDETNTSSYRILFAAVSDN